MENKDKLTQIHAYNDPINLWIKAFHFVISKIEFQNSNNSFSPFLYQNLDWKFSIDAEMSLNLI